jgi:hypothetical protein
MAQVKKRMLHVCGGETQESNLNHISGYPAKAQCTGKPAYFEPNSQSMQKPIEGLSHGASLGTIYSFYI